MGIPLLQQVAVNSKNTQDVKEWKLLLGEYSSEEKTPASVDERACGKRSVSRFMGVTSRWS
jgi:hypothetical protein